MFLIKFQESFQKSVLVFRCPKVCFLQLICRTSLFFKSNLELALSIILKERELHESKHIVVECRCLKTSFIQRIKGRCKYKKD